MIPILFPAALIAIAARAVPQDPMTRTNESLSVNVIEVDAVVLDAQGNAVSGLGRDDFELRVGGRKRLISNFYEIDRRAVERSAAPSKDALSTVDRRDYLVLFIDELHLGQAEKARALGALRAFVRRRVGAGSAAMLVASDGDVRILEKFTEDPQSLLRAIDAFERQPAHAGEYESQRRELIRLIEAMQLKQPGALAERREEASEPDEKGRQKRPDMPEADSVEIARQQMTSFAQHEQAMTERTIAALDRVIHSITGLDGRRVLVYLSDGLPMQPGAEVFQFYKGDENLSKDLDTKRVLAQMQSGDAMRVNLNAQFLGLARQAALAGVQVFAIDARGVQGFDEATGPNAMGKSRLDSALIRSNLHGPLRLLADETGGQAIIDENDMESAFRKLDDHLSVSYSLGFRSDDTGREDDIDIRVKKRGLTVHAVKHVRQRSSREQIADRVRAALYSGIEENPLEAEIAVRPLGGTASDLAATIRVPLPKLSIFPEEGKPQSSYAVYVAMLDEKMNETPVRLFLHRVAPSENAESVQSLMLHAKPGTYTISFAIVDGYSSQASYLQRRVTIPASN